MIELSRHERDALLDIGGRIYGDGKHPFFWREKSMPKLAAKGLVEPHNTQPRGWRITEAGKAAVLQLRRTANNGGG